MKKPNVLNILIVSSLLTFSACIKVPAEKLTSGHHLSASSSSIGSFHASGTNVSAGGAAGAKISLTGNNLAGKYVTVYVNPYTATIGTIPMGTNTGVVIHDNSVSPATSITSVSGTITFTAVTPDIIGTFSYTGSDGNAFTGSFNVAAPL